MAKYHLKDNGEPGVCKARPGKCPKTNDDGTPQEHHNTPEEAYEIRNSTRNHSQIKKTNNKVLENKQNFTPDKPQTFTIPSLRTKDAKVSVQVSGAPRQSFNPHVLQAWIELPDEGPVSFVQLFVRDENYHPSVGEHFAMCDIETKPSHRGKGYALELRQTLEKAAGLQIYSSGNMTPEGWEAFGKHHKTLPGTEAFNTPGVGFRSMGFVASWKDKIPRHMEREINYSEEQNQAAFELHDTDIYQKFDSKEVLWAED